ncbi:cation acetate symporter [Streptomyces sp. NPDC059894]|uniref:sodium/solute symporter n=1 Tax=unclassified Streptomyces TaxID=2593676 RepID=UPI0036476568
MAFTTIVTVTLMLCVISGPDSESLEEFYTGYGRFSPLRNGLAIAGDYVSAATVLGTGGVIALAGYDGIVLAVATSVSLALLMAVLAEPLRGSGRFTMGDTLAGRMPGRSARVTTAVVTLIALMPLMLVQLAACGDLVAFLLGFEGSVAGTGCIVALGLLMISYAAIGGMQGTAFVQVLKMVALIGSGLVVSVLLLRRFDYDAGALLDAAARRSVAPDAYLRPGLQFATGSHPRLDMVATTVTLALGAACLPHITMRLYGARSARQVRRSMAWAVSLVALSVLIIVVFAFGAAALVGGRAIRAADPQGDTAYLLAARAALGRGTTLVEALLLTGVTTALFLTLLASVAGMILACAGTLAHDVFAPRDGTPATPRREIRTARAAALGVGVAAVALAIPVQHRSLHALSMLSMSLGASVIAPALLYSLFWARYHRTGLLWTLIGGTAGVLLLFPATSLVSGTPDAVLPGHDMNWLPLATTGAVTIPLGFLLGWLGTVLPRPRGAPRDVRDTVVAPAPPYEPYERAARHAAPRTDVARD